MLQHYLILLDETVKQRLQTLCALLGVPLLVILVVDVCDTNWIDVSYHPGKSRTVTVVCIYLHLVS